MRRRALYAVVAACLLLAGASSCSTTRVLSEDEYRLVRTKIEVPSDRSFTTGDLQPYIKQKGRGWSPFMPVYNWSLDDEGKSLWGRIIRGIGIAPVVYDPSLVEPSCENIQRHLEYSGYYGSDVSPKVSLKGRKARVSYIVTPGKQIPVSSLTFDLPERGEIAGDFLSDSLLIEIGPGTMLSEASLEAETVRSTSRLRDKGYYALNKNYFSFVADTLSVPGQAALKMTLAEYSRSSGPQDAAPHLKYHIGSVQISHPSSLSIREKVLRDLCTVKPGILYSEEVVNNTYTRLSAMRLFSAVSIGLEPTDSSTVDCLITLTPSPLQGLKFNAEASTNSSGLLGLSPEVSYYHKNIFRGGEWLNLGFMGNFQFKPGDEQVRSTEWGVSTGISLPRFLFIPTSHFKGAVPRTEFGASYNSQDRPEYTRRIISTSFGYNGAHGNLYYQVYPLQLSIVRLFHIDDGFEESLTGNPFLRNAYQNHFDLGLGGMLYYTTDASSNPSGDYHYVRLQFSSAGNLLSAFKGMMPKDAAGSGMIWNTPFSQYIRGELTLGKTWRIGRNDSYAVAARLLAGAGYAYGNSSVLPFEQHFYGGGASSLRGWQSRSVGPGMSAGDETFVIPNQTGDMHLEANAEYRFPLVWKLAGAAFLDVGNVWTLQRGSSESERLGRFSFKNFPRSLAANWGMGLRLDLDFILVRVDLGLKVHDPSREEGQRNVGPDGWLRKGGNALHFGVGFPF